MKQLASLTEQIKEINTEEITEKVKEEKKKKHFKSEKSDNLDID